MSKTQIYNLVICGGLILLIVLRISGDLEENVISCSNFAGMAIAFISIIFKIEMNLKRKKQKYVCFALAILFIFISLIMCGLLLMNLIIVESIHNDVITLVALLFSIPADLYVAIFSPRNKSVMET